MSLGTAPTWVVLSSWKAKLLATSWKQKGRNKHRRPSPLVPGSGRYLGESGRIGGYRGRGQVVVPKLGSPPAPAPEHRGSLGWERDR